MKTPLPKAASGLARLFCVLLGTVGWVKAQSVVTIDSFDAAGSGTNSYSTGKITNVWANWFGTAFQSLTWDSTSDASNNPSSGSMKINLDFSGNNNQFEVYDFNGIYPPVNGVQYTNFQCAVRFAAGSATVSVNGQSTFGYLQFGVTDGGGQDYFGGVLVPANDTNWFNVSLPITPATDPNLTNIYNLLIHLYGPYYSPGLSGASTLWIDNIQFTGPSASATNCVVNWNDLHQRIDGFGASSAFNPNWTQAQANMFFSTNTGIGLSILRSRIAPGGTSVETGIMTMAQALGALVWSTPWSPAAAFKSNNSTTNGGNFLSADYQAYANQLAGYVVNMKQNYGVNLYALSVQNEPDASTSYESCLWTAQQIHDFVPYLHAALAAGNVASTRIMLPEDENWQTNLSGIAMNDPAVATNVGILACHDYNGGPPSNIPAPLPAPANPAAALWETEVSTFDPYDGSMSNALYWAQRIHLYLTDAQVNAFHYWWLISDNPDNEGLTDTAGNPAKRMYALGNFSRFVRPGFYRIGVVNNSFTSVSAYKNTNSGSFAIVAINSSAAPLTQEFDLSGFSAGSVTPWITSSSLSLASQPAVTPANASFSYTLPASSVVTFVGQGYIPSSNILLTGAAVKSNALVLTWNATAGATYSVLKTNLLAPAVPNWPVATNDYPAGGAAGGTLSFTHRLPSSVSTFYRVRSP